MRLTGPNVAKLFLPDGKSDWIVFDDALPGFGIRLRAGGKRVWIAQYRVGEKQRRLTIGSVDKVSAEAARAHAKDLLAKVQLGADPQMEKTTARAKASVTLGSIADRYLEEHAKGRLKARSYVEVDRHFRSLWKPLRELPIHQLSRADIAARLKAIAKENGPFAANRARASLSALYGWAMREGVVDANPVIGTNKATAEVSRDRVLSDGELSLIWNACRDDDYGRIVRLLILTGQRREEVGGMDRSEIDLDKGLWTIPRGRVKNGLAHEVPLSPAAIAIIADTEAEKISDMPKRRTDKTDETLPDERSKGDRDFLFGSGEGSFSGWSKSKVALDARIAKSLASAADAKGSKFKAMAPWRLHDLRRTVATRLGDIGVLPHVVEAVLNHISGHKAGVAGVYNRATYSPEKRQALDQWAKCLAGRI